MMRFVIVICVFGLLWFGILPSPALACTATVTPSSTPTADANGYIPPSPTPRPTRTLIPVGTVVAQLSTDSPIIAEGEVILSDDKAAGYYATASAQFIAYRHYRGSAVGVDFVFMPAPCSLTRVPFAGSTRGIFFFGEQPDKTYYYRANMPSSDAVRQSLALVVGPGQQSRSAATIALPVVMVMFGVNLLMIGFILRRFLRRRSQK